MITVIMVNPLKLNGCATGSADELVKNKIMRIIGSTTYWTSQENSNTNNAYNVNSSGTSNNNSKTTGYAVRAAAAYSDEEKEGWIDAFASCERKKKSSVQCGEYRMGNYEADLWELMCEVHERRYKPSTSTCFVVTYPRPREIFAAAFRDRIVQHWIVLRLEPLLERLFVDTGDVSFNCRRGYGTLAAVNALHDHIAAVTEGYSREAWLGRFDISSFFMSINKRVLLERVLTFARANYHGADKETLLYLLEVVVMHCPQKDCVRRSPLWMWRMVPKEKSLFWSDDDTGVPIGNITSQILANFLMTEMDEAMVLDCQAAGARYIRFVDDFVIVGHSKEFVLQMREKGEKMLSDIRLSLHPKKVYVQRAAHSVRFVGTVLCRDRCYTSNRMLGRLHECVRKLEGVSHRITEEGVSLVLSRRLERVSSSVNSYLGFMVHTSSYGVRRRLFGCCQYLWKAGYMRQRFCALSIKMDYKVNEILLEHETKERNETSARAEGVLVRSDRRDRELRRGRAAGRQLRVRQSSAAGRGMGLR